MSYQDDKDKEERELAPIKAAAEHRNLVIDYEEQQQDWAEKKRESRNKLSHISDKSLIGIFSIIFFAAIGNKLGYSNYKLAAFALGSSILGYIAIRIIQKISQGDLGQIPLRVVRGGLIAMIFALVPNNQITETSLVRGIAGFIIGCFLSEIFVVIAVCGVLLVTYKIFF